MIVRFLHKFVRQRQVFVPKVFMARKLRRQPSMFPQIEEVSPEERKQLDKQQMEETREKKIMSVKPRRLREPEEELEDQIGKLIDKGMSDTQIIEFMRRKQEEKESGKDSAEASNIQKKGEAKIAMLAQKSFNEIFEKNREIYDRQEIISKQKVLVQQIIAQTKQKPTKINLKQWQEDQLEQEIAKQFLKRERTLDIIEKRKDLSQFSPVSQSDVQNYLIPENLREKALEYKDNELKYLAELVRDNRPDVGHMLHRRTSKRDTEDDEQEKYLKQILGKTTNAVPLQKDSYPVIVESEEVKTDRLMKQYEEIKTPSLSDQKFQQKGLIDLQETNEDTSIFLDQNQKKLYKRLDKEASPIEKFKKKVQEKAFELQKAGIDIDIEDYTQIAKKQLFFNKQFLEDQQKFNQRLTRRQKLKEIKKVKKEMNKEEFEDTVDYKSLEQIEGFKPKKLKSIFGVPDEQKIETLNEKYARSIFGAKKEEWDHNYYRTIENMEEWMNHQVHSPRTVHPVFNSILIDRIEMNDALTVLKAVWRLRLQNFPKEADHAKFFQQKRIESKQKTETEQIKQIQATLQNITKIVSSKMCQELQLRYGPDIRFIYYKQSQEISDAKSRLHREMPQIIKEKIKSQVEKGRLKPKISVKQFEFLIGDLEHQFESNVRKLGDGEDPLKKKKSKEKNKGKARDNRTQDGKRKKYQRKQSASQRFWQKL